jgi:carboxymethylenebutenolidase
MSKAKAETAEQTMLDVWEEHTYTEFVLKDASKALATMSDNPHVLMVPIGIGGRGRDGVFKFYHDSFLAQLPADIGPTPISRTVGSSTLVEEAVYHLTHDRQLDWMIPGVPATGRHIAFGLVAIVQFEGDKIASEHLYWDHASLLAQLGVLDPKKFPITGVQSPHTLLEWSQTR